MKRILLTLGLAVTMFACVACGKKSASKKTTDEDLAKQKVDELLAQFETLDLEAIDKLAYNPTLFDERYETHLAQAASITENCKKEYKYQGICWNFRMFDNVATMGYQSHFRYEDATQWSDLLDYYDDKKLTIKPEFTRVVPVDKGKIVISDGIAKADKDYKSYIGVEPTKAYFVEAKLDWDWDGVQYGLVEEHYKSLETDCPSICKPEQIEKYKKKMSERLYVFIAYEYEGNWYVDLTNAGDRLLEEVE